MSAPDVDLTPWAVAVTVAGGLVGPQLAAYVGAYSIILIGWFGGVLYGLYRRSTDARMPVWAYVLATFIGSLMLTVPASEVLAKYVPFASTALLFPVAAALPAFPDKWADFGAWLLAKWEAARGGAR